MKSNPLSFCIVCHRLDCFQVVQRHCLLRYHKYVQDISETTMGFPFHYDHYLTNIRGDITSILNYDYNAER